MPTNPRRFPTRHLLAVCTFLVPLGVLAWLGGSELRRQGEQVQEATEREVLVFLRGAARTLDAYFDRVVPAALQATGSALVGRAPHRAARELREHLGHPTVLDLLLLDEHGSLVAPLAPPVDQGLPLHRLGNRSGSGTGSTNPPGPGSAANEALQLGDALLSRGEIAAGAAVLDKLVAGITDARSRGQRRGIPGSDQSDNELRARFLLGGAHRKLGQADAARADYERVLEMIGMSLLADAETQGLALLSEVALAELAAGTADRLRLLHEIGDGDRDAVADGLLRAVAERLLAGIPADAADRAPALDALRSDEARAHARAFAGDYEASLRETMGRKLRNLGGTNPVGLAFSSGGTSSLLVVRAAAEAERTEHHCAVVAVRFDLSLLLAEALDGAGLAGLSLVVHDSDGQPVSGLPPEATGDYSPPALATRYGLSLRAWPENLGERLAQADAARTSRMLLLLALFLVAAIGAIWLWRSAQREVELATLKVDLVSRVSHELKTPLSLIRMYGETLGMGRAKDAEQTARFGTIIARESERLTTMIQRLLDFSRQQAGTLVYTPERTELGALLARTAEAYRPHLQSRGTDLQTELPEGVVAVVDAAALEGAVVNLLENAAKYGCEPPAAAACIDLALQVVDGKACIEVRDRGRGIPAGEHERVFDSFYRASNAGEVRGAGLGLSLVRHFAEAHGGTITAAPRPGGGSIFRLTLPTDPTPP